MLTTGKQFKISFKVHIKIVFFSGGGRERDKLDNLRVLKNKKQIQISIFKKTYMYFHFFRHVAEDTDRKILYMCDVNPYK